MHQPTTPRAPWPAVTPLHTAEDLARFDALPVAEQARAAKLVMHTGCSLGQAIAAVEATRAVLAETR